MVQGQGSRHTLLERFRTTPRAVLLGTTSFWQGVDVPGDALSLVVIDRLPFEVPSDPVVEARVHRMRRQGRNPFRDYQVPAAVIGLKQGVGRLLRSQRDRGVLAVLDARLRTRSYGRIFLDSLPPFTRANTLAEVATFFKSRAAREK
jgi:ATP-dependent DNA helicase DinG